MLAHHRWGLRSLVAVGLLVFAARPSLAQVFPPGVSPFPGTPNVWNPWGQQYANPNFPWKRQGNAPPNNNGVRVMPSINSMPGILGSSVFPPFMNFSSWSDPALDNPWMNQSAVIPVRVRPPFVMNPFFNDPFALNPLLQQRAWVNRFNFPGYEPRTSLLDSLPPAVGPVVEQTPPIAIREPGKYYYKGIDLQVNTTTGSVYQPMSGLVTLADGSRFYRVAGTGLPTATGQYATGTGLYYNPIAGTFFSPSTGTISQPGRTNLFLPYIW